MAIKNIIQPHTILIDEYLRLRYPNKVEWEKALPWYQNPSILYYSEGVTDKVYDMDIINRMYEYLSKIGELYFIEIYEENHWKAIGDATLSEINMPIAIGYEKYWGKGIGKKVISQLIQRAKEIKLKKICIPAIYRYNKRSQNLFRTMGFVEVNSNDREKTFELKLN
ncbi:GNAT family N-acetyltransferase [Clostridium tagluense]|uniref:GNAT family N-acetyltransferase n=1 Tax=Clostridium tagluense TaxID=360422 RepID=UPI001CF26976|nr:GNAT family N-acetyltransferase [Clostridium tagluense]MCB2310456.1 GNAT family N-acetyltransferase [Clostridium tagluense]MCB2315378.1 GNAT family N-acetyltransferase [Clostridium tagluense]MCB2320229.1 GNAT family N-acetyltransferase [Clostridium tagluense]MCB2325120.1 GNAT family N-acetyltransferase [Clostridium tagluense]MCB2329972.1 GNAT family N-acetyltransferase [Clostridium tagluense]